MQIISLFKHLFLNAQTDWPNIIATSITSLLSAIIGAGAAIWVYRNSIRDQKQKEQEQKDATERSKLKYLHFLLLDSLRAIDSLVKSYDSFPTQLANNPLNTPILNYHPSISLNRIANRINQDEYYHASVNQLNTDAVSEIFLMIDNLNEVVNDSIDHLNSSKVKIAEKRSNTGLFHHELMQSVDEFLEKIDTLILNDQNEFVKGEIKKILIVVEHEGQKGDTIGMNYYIPIHEIFTNPLGNLLFSYKGIKEVDDIMEKAFKLHTIYESTISNNKQLVADLSGFKERIYKTTSKLHFVSLPLRNFIEGNK